MKMNRRIFQISFLPVIVLLALIGLPFLLNSDVNAHKLPAGLSREQSIANREGFDANSYYRLTTRWQGDGKSLDIVNDGKNNNQLVLADTGNFAGQHWRITPLREGYYRLTSEWQGDNKSLDVVNDGQNRQPILAETGSYAGQFWKITALGGGNYRLTTRWQGEGKSLDVVNDGKNNRVMLADSGSFSGQIWKITKVK